jgi:peptide/nickel transport system substrate-binding protein
MSNLKTANRLIGLVVLLATQLLAGCWQDDKQSGSGNVVVRLEVEPSCIGPINGRGSESAIIYTKLFDVLTEYDPHTLEVKPLLAKSLPRVERPSSGPYAGGMAVTFDIRPEAVWPNGQPVFATDYVFTLKAVLNPAVKGSGQAHYFDGIDAVKLYQDDPRRFTVLSKKFDLMLAESASYFIFPEYFYDPEGLMRQFSLPELADPNGTSALLKHPDIQKFAERFNAIGCKENPNLFGSGPYKLSEWRFGEFIMLTKRDDWWGNKLVDKVPLLGAVPDTIIYRFIMDDATASAALAEQAIDVLGNIDDGRFLDLKKNQAIVRHYDFVSEPMMAYTTIAINNGDKILKEKNVRKALAHLVDVDAIIAQEKYGLAKRAVGPIAPDKPYFNPSLQPVAFDVQKGIQLLEQAGWTQLDANGIRQKMVDGEMQPLRITYLFNASNAEANNVGLLLKDNFKKAGIDLELRG